MAHVDPYAVQRATDLTADGLLGIIENGSRQYQQLRTELERRQGHLEALMEMIESVRRERTEVSEKAQRERKELLEAERATLLKLSEKNVELQQGLDHWKEAFETLQRFRQMGVVKDRSRRLTQRETHDEESLSEDDEIADEMRKLAIDLDPTIDADDSARQFVQFIKRRQREASDATDQIATQAAPYVEVCLDAIRHLAPGSSARVDMSRVPDAVAEQTQQRLERLGVSVERIDTPERVHAYTCNILPAERVFVLRVRPPKD